MHTKNNNRFMVMMAAFSVVLMIFAVAMLVTAAPNANAAKQCNNAHAQILKIGIKKARTAFYCLLNEERKAAGFGTVESDPRIELAAQRHSSDMVERDYFSHYAPSPAPFGRTPGERLTAAGWIGGQLSEAIGGSATPYLTLNGWLLSKPHCQIVMGYAQDYVGFGWQRGTATLDVVGNMSDDYIKRTPQCPRRVKTTKPPFVKVKAIRNGSRLLIRMKSNVTGKVRIVVRQPWRKPSLYQPVRRFSVKLSGKPKSVKIRLKRAMRGDVKAMFGQDYTLSDFR